MLLHLHNQSFQVLPFKVVNAYRMIGWLRELMQDTHFPPGIGCCNKYGFAEILPANRLRTAEGKDDPSRSNCLKGSLIQSLVTLQSIT